MVHLFSGKDKEGDPLRRLDGARSSGLEELVYLEVDLARDKAWNVAVGPLYKVLLWAAAKGKIEGVFGGPPCRSYSLLRFREVPGLNLPRPVRSVQELWGKSRGLTVEEETLVHNDNKLILRTVWLWLVAEEGKRQPWGYDTVGSMVAFALEHPEDPREFLPRGDLYEQCTSFWRTALARELSHGAGLALLTYQFDQGYFGHDQRKPTKVLSNMDMANLDQMRDPRAQWEKPRTSSDMAAWAPGFRAILAQGLREWQGQSIVQVAAMSPEREALWREHIRQGHWPYRRDCRVCVEAAASGKPARKVVHRDAYVLSMDTAGPFKEKGMDENGEKYKYVLGFTYLFPKTFAAAAEAEIPDEVEDFEMDEYVPSEAEQEEEGESGELSRDEAKREEEWNKLLGDLTKPMEWQTLRFAIPLKGRQARETMEAIQDVYVYLRANGFPVARLHSDRAREFRTKSLHRWCLERDIYQTFTEGYKQVEKEEPEIHEEYEVELPAPERRLREKTTVRAVHCSDGLKLRDQSPGAVESPTSRPLSPTSQTSAQDSMQNPEMVAAQMAYDEEYDDEDLINLLRLVNLEATSKPVRQEEGQWSGSWGTGAFVHGGVCGLRNNIKKHPNVTMYLAHFIKKKIPKDHPFSALVVNVNQHILPHRDVHNHPEVPNMVYGCGNYQGGQIWQQTSEPEDSDLDEEWEIEGQPVRGRSFPVKGEARPLWTRRWHAVKDWKGDRITVVAFEPRHMERLSEEHKGVLEFLGFRPLLQEVRLAPMREIQTFMDEEEYPCSDDVELGSLNSRPRIEITSSSGGPTMSMEDRPPQLQPTQDLRGMTNPLSRASATSWFREERNGYAGGWEQDVQLQDGTIEVGVSWSLRYVAENGQEIEYDEGPTGRMSGVERVRYEDRLMWVSAILQEEVHLRQERATLGIDPDPRQQRVIDLLEELHQRLFDYLQIDIQREEEARMHMMKVSVEEAVTENVEQLLRDLDKPLEVVHNVSLQEVKQNLPVWIPSIGKEVTTLTSSGTLRPIPLSLRRKRGKSSWSRARQHIPSNLQTLQAQPSRTSGSTTRGKLGWLFVVTTSLKGALRCIQPRLRRSHSDVHWRSQHIEHGMQEPRISIVPSL